MADQLRLLRKENDLRMRCLKEENKKMLEKWIAYAKASDINPYDCELCRKELIGISLQKELEGKDLEHFFGEEQKEIAENIIQGCKRKNWKDYLAFDFRSFFCSAAIVYLIFDFITNDIFGPISVFNLLLRLLSLGIFFFYNIVTRNVKVRTKLASENLQQKDFSRSVIYLAFMTLLFIMAWNLRPFIDIEIPGFPMIAFPVMLGIFWLVLTIFYKKYLNQLVKERPWKD